MKNNYEIEVQYTDKVKVHEVQTIKEAIDFMNSFKETSNILQVEVRDLDTYEVIGRIK